MSRVDAVLICKTTTVSCERYAFMRKTTTVSRGRGGLTTEDGDGPARTLRIDNAVNDCSK